MKVERSINGLNVSELLRQVESQQDLGQRRQIIFRITKIFAENIRIIERDGSKRISIGMAYDKADWERFTDTKLGTKEEPVTWDVSGAGNEESYTFAVFDDEVEKGSFQVTLVLNTRI